MEREPVAKARGTAGNSGLLTGARPVPLVLAPGWTELPWLVHGFSTRIGGVSTVYPGGAEDPEKGALNLGFTATDDPECVRANRERLLLSLAGSSSAELPRLVTLRQTHSATSCRVSAADAQDPEAPAVCEGDGLMTSEPGVLLGVQTADCVPVLVVDPVRRAVAAFHAGWRGTVARIVEAGVARMEAEFGSQPAELMAAIGPAIGRCCYTVGAEVRERFMSSFGYASDLFVPRAGNSSVPDDVGWSLDLQEANRRQLLAAGLRAEAVQTTPSCTSCETNRFFSHRAEAGHTGRMLAIVGIRQS